MIICLKKVVLEHNLGKMLPRCHSDSKIFYKNHQIFLQIIAYLFGIEFDDQLNKFVCVCFCANVLVKVTLFTVFYINLQYLDDLNMSSSKEMKLVFFVDAMQHVAR